MKDVETITGQISNIERRPSSKNGNPRYRFQVSSGAGENFRSVTVYTAPDSMLAYEITNYQSADVVTVDVGWHHGVLTLADIRE